MFCPECGSEAGEAKFCPECGNDLGTVRNVMGKGAAVPTTGGAAKSKGGAAGRPKQQSAAQRPNEKRNTNAAYLWGVIAVIAIVVIAVVLVSKGSSDKANPGVGNTPPSLAEVSTSGSYAELVQRGNDYYDRGQPYIDKGDPIGGAAWFAAAAKVYAAAWAMQPGDPALGTDYATAIFYSGNVEGAVKQIEKVIAKNPEFQNARFNHGNYLSHQSRILEQQGKKAQAAKLASLAKVEYEAAVRIDPSSGSGQAAAAALKKL